MKKELLAVAMLLFAGGNLLAQPHVNDGTSYLMNQPLDMSTDFRDLSNTLFFADHLESFDAKSGEGLVNWKRGHLMPRQAFNTNGAQPRKMRMLDFPFTAYENDPNLKFKIDFVTPRTVRIRMLTTPVEPKPAASIMLAKEPDNNKLRYKLIENNDKTCIDSPDEWTLKGSSCITLQPKESKEVVIAYFVEDVWVQHYTGRYENMQLGDEVPFNDIYLTTHFIDTGKSDYYKQGFEGNKSLLKLELRKK